LTAKLGISAGKNNLGKSCYIGRGLHNRQMVPGRLMVEPTQSAAVGLYIEYALKEHFLTSNIEFYAKEPNCNYKWIPSSNGQDVTNAVQFKNDSYTFYMGRAFLHGSTQVGKVVLDHRVMYFAFGGKGFATATYEVLTCESLDSEAIVVDSAEIENDKLEEMKRLNEELKSQISQMSDENKNLTTEVSLLRERLLEKIYLISTLHTKLSDCKN
jgi:hypothetical protein